MPDKTKILIIENSIAVTGALKSIMHTAYYLQKHFEFIFVIPQHSKGRYWIESKGFVAIYELPLKEISRRLLSLLLYFPFLLINSFRLNQIVKRENVSIIHLNDLYNLLPVVIKLFGSKVPYVCYIRFMPDRFPPWLFNFWLRLHLRYAAKVMVVSHSIFNKLSTHPKLVLVPNELPLEENYPDFNQLDQQKNTYTFLYLSNFMEGKGQNFALDAFAKIHGDIPTWKIRFVGGDMGLKKNMTYKIAMQERAKALGFFEKTEWHGFTNSAELEYKQADIVLNFSESESFSITCAEALYFGRPLIATDCGGPAEIIDSDETGILVANRDVEAIAKAMKQLALDDDLQKKLGLAARKKMIEKIDLQNNLVQLKVIYEHALLQG
jgi:L-malate glycosyltransferase